MKQLTVFCFCVSLALVQAERVSYDGYIVVKYIPTSKAQFQLLQDLVESNIDVEFWHEPRSAGEAAHLMMPRKIYNDFAGQNETITGNIIVKDVQGLIELEKADIEFSLDRLHNPSSVLPSFRLDVYHSYSEIKYYMDEVGRRYPDITEVGDAGNSLLNRQINYIKIGRPSTSARKKAFYIDAGIHSREWISIAVAVYIIDQLTTRYGWDAEVTRLVDDIDWYIMPVVNPDGYEHSRTTDRLWRKNRNENGGPHKFWKCSGVDLNRNFDFAWASSSSNEICSDQYHGRGPFSEPEAKAVRHLVDTIGSRLEAYVTLHSYGQSFLYPYGVKSQQAGDWRIMKDAAQRASHAISRRYGTHYKVGTSPQLLYEASGNSQDWVKWAKRTKLTYVMELRPEYNGTFSASGFILPTHEILPVCEESWDGMKSFAREF